MKRERVAVMKDNVKYFGCQVVLGNSLNAHLTFADLSKWFTLSTEEIYSIFDGFA